MIGVLLLVTKATASKSPASKVILVLKGGRGRNPRSLVKFCRQNCATYFNSLFFVSLTSQRVIAISTVLAACK